jgi:predicted dehydrogenase
MVGNVAEVGVALIGTAFMGRAHSHAWRSASHFFDLPLRPKMKLLVGADPIRTVSAAETLGWHSWSSDWREAVNREDIDLIDICTPGYLHEEIAVAALEAGKHVICEKPLANDVHSAERMANAAKVAAPRAFAVCGFSYRRTPALALAKKMIQEGALGKVRHVRAQYLQDWLSDRKTPWSWRLDKSLAGSGALGDIAAHSIDIVQWLLDDQIEDVSSRLVTFVSERAVADGRVDLGGEANESGKTKDVTVDDAAAFTANLKSGALGVFEATRFATGRRNANRVEINGEFGSIAFDFERLNELEYFDARQSRSSQGFSRIQATDSTHPYTANWWPVGHGIGYGDLFVNQAADILRDLAANRQPQPDFDSALDVQRVLEAVSESASANSVITTVKRQVVL